MIHPLRQTVWIYSRNWLWNFEELCSPHTIHYLKIPVSLSLFWMLHCICRYSLPRLIRQATLNCIRFPTARLRIVICFCTKALTNSEYTLTYPGNYKPAMPKLLKLIENWKVLGANWFTQLLYVYVIHPWWQTLKGKDHQPWNKSFYSQEKTISQGSELKF